MMKTPAISVIIPSYRRPQRLAECLAGVANSDRQPDEVLVVVRADDHETADMVSSYGGSARAVTVSRPGQLAAMTAGVNCAGGDLIAFLDDDAVPRRDWLSRLLAHLEDPGVGAAGGRDIVTDPDDLPRNTDAGRLTRWGKLIGNHHVVIGHPRDVDVLKGANMAFKREALALPTHLFGEGAQVHNEVATCLWATNRGWRLVLDPDAQVLHLPGERFDADRRCRPSPRAIHDAACNFNWCLLSMRPRLTALRLAYGLAIGDRGIPGIGRATVALMQGDRATYSKLLPSLTGQLRGAMLVFFRRRVPMQTFI
jgi:cellulose synthase/poly-beta-1,6-N-acetylglucosamine synthase-like glycosyltransferase